MPTRDYPTLRHVWKISNVSITLSTECDSSDSGHVYESLEPGPEHAANPALAPVNSNPPPLPLEDDFDSFDSDTDDEQTDKVTHHANPNTFII